jgi:hypothetical protein
MRIARYLTLAAFLIGSSIFAKASHAIEKEETESDEGRIAFAYGGECSQLAQLSRLQIQAVTHAVHAENFDRFCHAQGIYSCSDYTAMLEGAGVFDLKAALEKGPPLTFFQRSFAAFDASSLRSPF